MFDVGVFPRYFTAVVGEIVRAQFALAFLIVFKFLLVRAWRAGSVMVTFPHV